LGQRSLLDELKLLRVQLDSHRIALAGTSAVPDLAPSGSFRLAVDSDRARDRDRLTDLYGNPSIAFVGDRPVCRTPAITRYDPPEMDPSAGRSALSLAPLVR
jgi:hypothetical protein